jgi:hypothetical protein
MLTTIARTPWMLKSWRVQRTWEQKILTHGDLPWRFGAGAKLLDLPIGHMFFGFVCFCAFGVDIMSGIITGFDVAQRRLDEARVIRDKQSEVMLEKANKLFERKLETVDLARRVKEMGSEVALQEGPRRQSLHYGGQTGMEVPVIPGA